ncbi:MAG: hypothetical protein KJO69_08195 [Gammaproteobacteria bacterium]|nr:hypothetical protein [Gammaproteobacteria bacterium]
MDHNVNIELSPELRAAIEDGSIDISKLKVGGAFGWEHIRNGEVIDSGYEGNIVTDEGLTYILDVALSNGSANATHYLGIYKNNYTPLSTDTASTFAGAGVANEISTEVDETTRPTWVEAGVATKSITNSASPAAFTANATVSAYGAFLISNNTMGGLTGKLVAASKFTAVRNLVNTDVLNVTYTLTIADA